MILAVLLLLLASVSGASAQAPPLPPIVDVLVPNPPVPARSNDKALLVYELHVTNFGQDDITIDGVEALSDDGARLVRYAGRDLEAVTLRPGLPSPAPGQRPALTVRAIGAGMRAVIWMWIRVEPGSVPKGLRHRLEIAAATPAGRVAGVLEPPRVEVRGLVTPVLDPPFRDGMWLAGNGPSNESVHRRALIAALGRARIAQRFAIDWVKLGDDGRMFRGDPTQNASWYGYGEAVLAAADGVVTEVVDGIPDNVPLSKPVVPITLETVAGNHVLIEHGRGRFALYAHLQPGSPRVKVGDRVKRGQPLGRLGNSGNSDAPHVHFHIADAGSPLGAEGLPYALERYERMGTLDLGERLETAPAFTPKVGLPANVRTREIPSAGEVVRLVPPPARP